MELKRFKFESQQSINEYFIFIKSLIMGFKITKFEFQRILITRLFHLNHSLLN